MEKGTLPVKLFVGQIPKSLLEDDIRLYFEPFGNIVEIVILRDRTTGQHKGAGFVTYSSKEEAESAIEALHTKTTIPPQQKPLQVKLAEGELEKFDSKLFIGQLPRTTTEADINALFSPFGNIVDLSIVRNAQGYSKGCAFVRYETRNAAEEAIKAMNNYHINENPLTGLVVKFADTEKQKKERKLKQTFTPSADNLTSLSIPFHPPYAQPLQGHPPLPYPQTVTAVPSQILSNPNVSGPLEGPPGCNIVVYNLPSHYVDEDLERAFSPWGNLITATVFIDRETRQTKGFGFVSFDNPQNAEEAVQNLNGILIGDRKLKVVLKKGPSRGKPY